MEGQWSETVFGRMVAEGWLDPGRTVEHYLPEIGSGYRGATVQDVLDMNVMNDFSEDYDDPQAECYTEEIALGWRLPGGDAPEVTMHDVVTGITSADVRNHADTVNYCSANTDLLTPLSTELLDTLKAAIPLGRFAEVSEIAPAVVFLASDAGNFFHGSCISPNGGEVMF